MSATIRWTLCAVLLSLSPSYESAAQVSFGKTALQGANVLNPTSLQFGPDGRLYVAQEDGHIKAFSIAQGATQFEYNVTATETINLIRQIPNHNDDGTPNPSVTDRLVTGILVAGTAANPVIYVSSSDPRTAIGVDSGLDTNSGTLSRLTWNGSQWVRLDLVRGLPRNEENHASNGMQLEGNTLYLAQGGNANMGAPSNSFAYQSEYALSAAILSIDLAAIGETTYDIPTLDDPSRSNTGPGGSDEGDPFGGNNGLNQAKIIPGGPVQVYSSGWRNSYDLVITEAPGRAGRKYAIDNGANKDWGGLPVGEGPGGNCTNEPNEAGTKSDKDNLHLITGPGYYAGHPAPIRGNPAGAGLYDSNGQPVSPLPADWPPVPASMANPIECDYLGPVTEDGALTSWSTSTNGIAEYTASSFGGSMQGDLLAAFWGNDIVRVQLNAAGDQVLSNTTLFSNVGSQPLDVTAQSDTDVFPGTIWVADYSFAGGGGIFTFTPASGACDLSNPNADSDGDGYTNQDELDNGTDPCSSADIPSDADGDFTSDLNDADDDNDGIDDVDDAFAIDAGNGANTFLPLSYSWFGGDPGTGFFGLGFTGLMTNGETDYLLQYNPENMTAGGAAGKLTVDDVPGGTAGGSTNSQLYGFQFGVNVSGETEPFFVRTSIQNPFFGVAPQDFQSMGLFIGTGDQDNYLKIVTEANNGNGGIEVGLETGGSYSSSSYGASVLGAGSVELYLKVDPDAATVQPGYVINSGARVELGQPVSIPAGWLSGSLAVGILSTSSGAPSFPATWEYMEVVPATVAPNGILAEYDFLEGADPQVLYDLTGNGFNGTLGASADGDGSDPAWTAEGLRLDGTNDFVDIGNTMNIGPDEDQTVLLYFKPDVVSGNQALFNKRGTEPAYHFARLLSNGNVRFQARNTAGSTAYDVQPFGSGAVVEDEYRLLSWRLENGQRLRLGLDGGTFADAPFSPSQDFSNGKGFAFGALTLSGNVVNAFNGTLAYARIYNYALTDAEVASAYGEIAQAVAARTSSLTATPPSLDFGEVAEGTASPPQSVVLTNVSGAAVALSSVGLTGSDATAFTITRDPTGTALAPGDTVHVRVAFAPSSTGAKSAQLEVAHGGQGSPLGVALGGEGTPGTETGVGHWESVAANNSLTPRHENSFVFAGEKFYLMGGRGGITPVEAYDPATQDWSFVTDVPREIHHFQAVEHDGLIYAIMAMKGSGSNEVGLDNVYIFDPVAGAWIVGPAIPADRRRGSAGVAVYNNKFYIVGGLSGGHDGSGTAFSYFDEYDPTTNTWTVLPDAPRPRDHFHAVVVEDKLYAVGGRESGVAGFFNNTIAEVDVYDFSTGTWSTLPAASNIPVPRAASATALLSSEIIVSGGEGNGQTYKRTEAFDPATGSWRQLADAPTSRHATQAAVSNGGMYVAAGSETQGGGGETGAANMEAFYFGASTTPSGTPTAPGALSSTPASLDFGGLPAGASTSATSTLNNTGGNQGIVITGISIVDDPDEAGDDASAFALNLSFTLPVVVAPGGALDVEALFQPADTGTKGAILRINHASSSSPLDIALGGEGTTSGGSGGAGLLAEYDFLEGADPQRLYDLSGGGLHGTLGTGSGGDTSDPSWTGEGLSFDGADDFVSLGDVLDIGAGEDRTVLLYFKAEALSGNHALFNKRGTEPAYYYARLLSNGNVRAQGRNTSGGNAFDAQPLGSGAVAVGSYHLLSWRLENGQRLRLGLDGGTFADAAFSPSQDFSNGKGFVFGALTLSGNVYNAFNGTLAYARVYDRALTDAEVASAYGEIAQAVAARSGSSAGSLTASPASLDFGQVEEGTASPPQSVVLTNNSGSDVTLSTISVTGADAAAFTITRDPGSVTLAPGDTVHVRVAFSPSSAGAKSAQLEVAHDGSGSPLGIALGGEGTTSGGSGGAGLLAEYDFLEGADPQRLYDLSGGGLHGTLGTGSGGDTSDPSWTGEGLSFDGADDFVSLGDVLDIGAGEDRTVLLYFKAEALSGNHALFNKRGTEPAYYYARLLSNGNVRAQGRNTSGGNAFDAQPLGSGAVAVGSYHLLSWRLENGQRLRLGLDGGTFADAAFSPSQDFSNGKGFVFGALTLSGNVYNAFNGTLAYARVYDRALTDAEVASAYAEIAQAVAARSGSSAGSLTASPASLDFGQVEEGATSASRSVVLTNNGSGDVTLSSVALSGGGAGAFALTRDPAGTALASGDTVHVRVAFAPSSTGAKSAQLEVAHDGAGSPLGIALGGEGTTSGGSGGAGLLAEYDFLEGADPQRLYDLSGGGLHGTLGTGSGGDTSDPSWTGEGLSFDGADDFVSLGDVLDIGAGEDRTVLLYFKAEALSGNHALFNKRGTEPAYYYARLLSNGNVRAQGRNTSGGNAFDAQPLGSGAVAAGSYHLLSWRLENGQRLRLGLDGGTFADAAFSPSQDFSNGKGFVFGALTLSGNVYNAFNGTLAYARVYDRALTDAEVASAYAEIAQAVAARSGALTASLNLEARLEEQIAAVMSTLRAQAEPGNVQLTWQTRQATTSVRFSVERRIAAPAPLDASWHQVGALEGGDASRLYRYTDTALPQSKQLEYRLRYEEEGQATRYSQVVRIETVPVAFELLQNYPNPFNPITHFPFELPRPGHVRLRVYDSLGREVALLVDEERPAGRHRVQFDGSAYASGIYVYRLEYEGQAKTGRMVLVK